VVYLACAPPVINISGSTIVLRRFETTEKSQLEKTFWRVIRPFRRLRARSLLTVTLQHTTGVEHNAQDEKQFSASRFEQPCNQY
jgi:hypothetical protein